MRAPVAVNPLNTRSKYSLLPCGLVALAASLLVGCASAPPEPPAAVVVEPPKPAPTKFAVTKAIYNQKLKFSVPLYMSPVYENIDSSRYTLEYITASEQPHNWSNMVSVAGFRGAAKDLTADQAMLVLGQHLQQSCPDKFSFIDLGPTEINGYKAHQGILGCGVLAQGVAKGMSEVNYTLTIVGMSDVFVLQKSRRGFSFDPQYPPINQLNYAEFSKDLFPVQLCLPQGTKDQCF